MSLLQWGEDLRYLWKFRSSIVKIYRICRNTSCLLTLNLPPSKFTCLLPLFNTSVFHPIQASTNIPKLQSRVSFSMASSVRWTSLGIPDFSYSILKVIHRRVWDHILSFDAHEQLTIKGNTHIRLRRCRARFLAGPRLPCLIFHDELLVTTSISTHPVLSAFAAARIHDHGQHQPRSHLVKYTNYPLWTKACPEDSNNFSMLFQSQSKTESQGQFATLTKTKLTACNTTRKNDRLPRAQYKPLTVCNTNLEHI